MPVEELVAAAVVELEVVTPVVVALEADVVIEPVAVVAVVVPAVVVLGPVAVVAVLPVVEVLAPVEPPKPLELSTHELPPATGPARAKRRAKRRFMRTDYRRAPSAVMKLYRSRARLPDPAV
jgi:hypothetical protein